MDEKSGLLRNKFILLLIIAVVIIVAFLVALQLSPHKSVHYTSYPKNYTVVNPNQTSSGSVTPAGYTLDYSSQWKRTTPADTNYTVLTSTQNNISYKFRISPPSQTDPEAQDNLTTQAEAVTYGGRKYVRTVWKTNGQAFHITAVPQDLENGGDLTNVYVMVMDFPPTSSGDYINVFNQIAQTVKY